MCFFKTHTLIYTEQTTTKPTYNTQIKEDSTIGNEFIHVWDGDAWLEEKWKRDQDALEKGETPRRWFW